MGKRIYVIAGEASGDLHGGNLIAEILAQAGHQPPTVRAWGGDRMAAAGATVVKYYRDLAFMGFTQVVMNLRTILRNIRECKEDILAFAPDALVLIDYPGFNLRIADWARKQGIPVFYYISPQLWAWKEDRLAIVKRAVDRMFCILPFEKAWYAERGVDVDFVGHPLLDEMARSANAPGSSTPDAINGPGNGIVALLPGSRVQEIGRMLPAMLAAAKHFPHERFVVAAAPSVPEAYYRRLMGDAHVDLVIGGTHDLLKKAKAAVVTSGTATLETALFGVPEVVCYSGNAINVWLARRLVKVRFISLVNLIMDREAVRELVQQDMNADAIRHELDRLLHDTAYRDRMIADLALLREKLGGPGASARTARLLWKNLERTP